MTQRVQKLNRLTQKIKQVEEREFLDSVTGEVKTLRIITEEIDKTKSIKKKKNNKVNQEYVRLFPNIILDSLSSGYIDYDEVSLLTTLALFVDWSSNTLIDEKGRPYSIAGLAKKLNKHRTWLTNKLHSLEEKKFIILDQKNKSTEIILSPKIAWKGELE